MLMLDQPDKLTPFTPLAYYPKHATMETDAKNKDGRYFGC